MDMYIDIQNHIMYTHSGSAYIYIQNTYKYIGIIMTIIKKLEI